MSFAFGSLGLLLLAEVRRFNGQTGAQRTHNLVTAFGGCGCRCGFAAVQMTPLAFRLFTAAARRVFATSFVLNSWVKRLG